jgi:methanogenic corrinoid protein MtbC1
MTEIPYSIADIDVDHYATVQAKLRQLKSQLPQNLVESLAREVIRQMTDHVAPDLIQSPDRDRIEQLCNALTSKDDQAGARFIQTARDDGATDEAIYLNYLAGAALMLGTWWEENRLTFAEVTYGTSRMYAIMRSMRREIPLAVYKPHKAAVFATVPGESHFLGVSMAADLLRKDGWDIDLKIGLEHDELVEEIARSGMILIGLSASSDQTLEALSKLIVAVRIRSPHVAIFVSGHIVIDRPETLELMDVDGFAADFQSAKAMLESHLANRAQA